ncbi:MULTISPECIES: DUF2812 domain-containing protein [unclassified Streptococcus]|uniref:DUF2812 domain-containing protein n=1 Tax=unclassified Streptococcus TaxID=2608887 RepID=UPI00359E63A3
MTTKTEVKFFFITDFEEEANYLTAMHRKGWKLTKIRFDCLFHFEETAPQEVVYRLDFKDNGRADQETYYQLYRDYGWEPVTTCNSFEIFRKPASQVEDDDIFSDETSRWEMIRQIFIRRFLILLSMVVLTIAGGSFFNKLDLAVTVAMIDVPICFYVGYRFYQLWKKYRRN